MKRMIIVLTAVMVVSGFVLASAYTLFLPQIQANRKAALDASLNAIFSGAESPSFEKLDTDQMTIYRASGGGGTTLGYAVNVTASGYGGDIQLLVGLSADLQSITGMQVVEQIETPGLGGRIQEAWFKKQFEGLDPRAQISYVKNTEPDKEKNQIQAISGATISSNAVVTGLNNQLEPAIQIIKQLDK